MIPNELLITLFIFSLFAYSTSCLCYLLDEADNVKDFYFFSLKLLIPTLILTFFSLSSTQRNDEIIEISKKYDQSFVYFKSDKNYFNITKYLNENPDSNFAKVQYIPKGRKDLLGLFYFNKTIILSVEPVQKKD